MGLGGITCSRAACHRSDEDSVPTPEDRTPLPWFKRVLPLSLVVLLVLAVAAVVSPPVRHQLDLSVTRRPDPYVELYFSRSTSGSLAVCTRSSRSVRVSFVVESHLATRRAIAYRAVVDPVRKGLRTHRRAGSRTVSPGKKVRVTATVKLSRRAAYVVRVALPGTGQELRAHCRGPG